MSADGFDASELAPKVWAKIGKQDRKRTSIKTIARDLKDAASRIAKQVIRQQETAQMAFAFFKLPGAVSLDLEGRKIKFTRSLTRLEYQRASKIRKDHHTASGDAIKEFDAAEAAVAPYWDQNPEWTFGQCLDQFMSDKQVAA